MNKDKLPAKDKLALAVNAAMGQIHANLLNDNRLAQARLGLLNPGGGYAGMDTKRSQAWCEYGFPIIITFEMLYQLYRRGGLAHGGINKVVDRCWLTPPEIIEGNRDDKNRKETPWEKKIKDGVFNEDFWSAFAEADVYRLVGRYSGLLLHVADNEKWHLPVTRKGSALAKVTPVWASSLKVVSREMDSSKPNYGEPTMWQYTNTDAQGASIQTNVHPDRVFILGDTGVNAIGFLEPAYNAFVSLEKVEGGSGESFLKNAARQLAMNFDKEVNLTNIATAYGVEPDELQEKINELSRDINSGSDNIIVTQGAQTAPLTVAVADPKGTYEVNASTAASAMGMPVKILVGMQTGERASTEDQKEFNGTCQSRRNKGLTSDTTRCAKQLMRIGIIDTKPKITASWDDLTAQTPEMKLASAKVMAEVNQIAVVTGEIVFQPQEIRVAAGYEPNGATPLPEGDGGANAGDTNPDDKADADRQEA